MSLDDKLDNITLVLLKSGKLFGPSGSGGADGKTPYIQDGYWYIDGVNTNVKARGEDYVLTDEDINEIVNLVSSDFGTRIDNIETTANKANNANQAQDQVMTTIQSDLAKQGTLITENSNQISEITDRINNLSHLSIEKVDNLESITNPSTSVIYIIPIEEGNFYREYIWLLNEDGTTGFFEQIGTTEVDLSNYVTLAAYNAAMTSKQQEIEALGSKVTALENVKYYRHNIEIRYRNDNTSLTEAAGLGKFLVQFSIINQNPNSYYFARYQDKTNNTVMSPEDAWELYRLFRDLRETTYPGHGISNVIFKAATGTSQYCFTAESSLVYGNINCLKTKYYQFSGNDYYTRILQIPFSRLDSINEFNTTVFEVHCGQVPGDRTTPIIYPDPPADSATVYNTDWYENDYCNSQYGDGSDYTKQRIVVHDWVELAHPL